MDKYLIDRNHFELVMYSVLQTYSCFVYNCNGTMCWSVLLSRSSKWLKNCSYYAFKKDEILADSRLANIQFRYNNLAEECSYSGEPRICQIAHITRLLTNQKKEINYKLTFKYRV